nr:hypothetical protein [uncultured Gellertiella sp.]
MSQMTAAQEWQAKGPELSQEQEMARQLHQIYASERAILFSSVIKMGILSILFPASLNIAGLYFSIGHVMTLTHDGTLAACLTTKFLVLFFAGVLMSGLTICFAYLAQYFQLRAHYRMKLKTTAPYVESLQTRCRTRGCAHRCHAISLACGTLAYVFFAAGCYLLYSTFA